MCARSLLTVIPGTGPRLQDAIRNIIDHSLDNITRHLAAKTASAVVASTSSPGGTQGQSTQQTQVMYESGEYYNPNPQPQYPQAGYTYASNQSGTASYPAPPGAFDNTTYHPNSSTPHANLEAQLHTLQETPDLTPQRASSFLAAFQSPPHPQPGFSHHPPPQFQPQSAGGPAAWRNFTDAMMTSMGDLGSTAHDYAPPPSLMSLKSGDAPVALDAAVALGMHLPNGPPGWPLLPYGGHASPSQEGDPRMS